MHNPYIIGISGVSSNSGKTTFASALLKFFTSQINNPYSERANTSSANNKAIILKSKKRWGAIKYTKTDFYSSLIDDPNILNESGKDTQRFIESGAEEVLWVQSTQDDLPEIMTLALDRLHHLDGIIVEGNSAIDSIKPDIIILVSIGNNSEVKVSAWDIFDKANIFIVSADSPLYPFIKRRENCKVVTIQDFQNNLSTDIIVEVIDYMENSLNKNEELHKLLLNHSSEKRISCSEARRIAEELGVPYSEVGKAADELKIKIRNCELGCF